MLKRFLVWITASPFGVAAKVGAAAGVSASLTYTVDHITTFNLPPVVSVGLAVALVPIVDALNRFDPRFGKVAKPTGIPADAVSGQGGPQS